MSKVNNKKDNILKSKFFFKLFGIPACICIYLSLMSISNLSNYASWKKAMVEDLMILGLWFGISFLIAKSYKKKQEKDIKIGITLEKKGKGNSTFKKIRFSLIMSIITFLIGIFFAYDLIGFPLKTKLIGLFVAFIPFMLFMIILIMIYVNKENQKIFSISKKFQ